MLRLRSVQVPNPKLVVSQVILENVYKSFSSRKGEGVTSQKQIFPHAWGEN